MLNYRAMVGRLGNASLLKLATHGKVSSGDQCSRDSVAQPELSPVHFSRPLPRPSVGKHYPRAVLRCSYPAVLANGVTHGPFSRSTALLSRTSSSRSPGQRTSPVSSLERMAPADGVAPSSQGSKPRVLRLHQAGMKVVGATGFAPATSPPRTVRS